MLVSETTDITAMDYMADAVLEMEDDKFEGQANETCHLEKAQGFEIPQRSYAYTLNEGRFLMIETPLTFAYPSNPVWKPFEAIKHGDRHYSTGITILDSFLGGGLVKGGLVLLDSAQTSVPLRTSR